MRWVVGILLVLVSSTNAELLLEGRVLQDSGQPASGARVRLFDSADLARSVLSTADESGYFALPLTALSLATPIPARIQLGQNYPNPFNPSTIIPYQLPYPARVRLEVFNILGQRVATLVDGERPAGFHTATWDATDASGRGVASGVYLYRLLEGGQRLTRSMVLLDGPVIPGGGGSGSERPTRGIGTVGGTFGGAAGSAGGTGTEVGVGLEGAADRSGRTGGVGDSGAWASSRADGPVYGLTVTGPGLVPWVDPAFRLGSGPVEIRVRPLSSLPRGKVASGGLLGDVNRDGQVDLADALLISSYSADPTLSLGNGDITLGDVNGDGQVDLTDARLIETYHADPSDASLPAGIGAPVGGAGTIWLYWTDADGDRIQRSLLDGSGVEDVIDSGLLNPRGLAVDEAAGRLYWTDYGTDKIQRANLDGSQVEDLVTTGLRIPLGLAVDAAGGKIYWTDNGTDKIQRANLDGSEVEDLVTGLRTPLSLAVDADGGKLYWSDSGTDKIQRANLDGSEVEELVTEGLESPRGLALDSEAGKIYWSDNGTDRIQRANLDGSKVEELVREGLESPRGLALDSDAGKVYWVDSGTGKIQRADLDGSEIEDLVTSGLLSPRGVVLVRTVAGGNRAPVLARIADRTAAAGDTLTLAATGSDPDGDALTYTVSSSAGTVASVEAADSLVTVYPLSSGRATITVTVRDPDGLEAMQRFTVAVGAGGPGPFNRLYWTDAGTDRIQRAHLDGSGVEDLVTRGLVSPRGLAVDQEAGKLYWTDYGSDRIQRSNLDGTEVEDLVTTGLQIPLGLVLDTAGGKMYWADNGADRIQRANLDGTETEDVVTGLGTPLGLALDVSAGKLYWADSGPDRIQRSNLDGTEVVDLVTTGLQVPRGLVLDSAGGKMYWADSGADRIQRANLDGTEIEDLVTTGLGSPRGLVLDVSAGKLYWADSGPDRIQRSNLDGTEVENLVTEGLESPRGLALARIDSASTGNQAPELEPLADRTAATGDSLILELTAHDPDGDALTYAASSSDEAVATVETADSLLILRLLSVGETTVTVTAGDPGGLQATQVFSVTAQASNEAPVAVPWLYWTDARTDRIQRAELDGSGVRTLVSGLMQPRDIALDRNGGRMYWTDSGSDKIQRANLDGSRVEDLVTEGLQEPFGIALDFSGGRIYWSDWGTDKIQRANLDGSGVEDLISTGLKEPYGLAVDPGEGKIYWTDWGTDKIQRANLDGSGVEDLVTGLKQPRGIALDLGEDKMYWPDWGTDKIQRANLDGSQVEDLVTEGLQTSQAIALDPGGGKMYWTDYGTDKIQRANLDGSQVEDLVTYGLQEPYGLALGAGLSAQVFKAGGDSATLNLAGRFRDPEGGALTLTAASSDAAVATATLADTLLTIAPVTPGQVTVSVTARDEGGRAATLPVPVTVYPTNRPPVAGTLADRKIRIDRPARVDLSTAFTDPDVGDVLAYTAGSSNETVATAAVEGSGLNLAPKSLGQARISVTARDSEGLDASLSFAVTVEPKPPPRPPQPPSAGGGGPISPPPPPPPPPGPNNPPSFDEGATTSRTVAENTPANRSIQHPVRATDPDRNRLTYRLSGTDEASFAVVAGSGQLRTRSGITYDFETKNRYEVTLEADDTYGGTDLIDVTVHVADVDEPPQPPARPLVEQASTTSLTVTWTEPVNTGPDVDDYDVQYRKSGSFLPWPHDGPGTSTTIPDLDPNTRYEVQVRAHNDEGPGGWSPSGFGNTGANRRPVFDESASTRSLDENTTGTQNIGRPVSATDPENTPITYSLSGRDVDSFTLDENSGQLRTRDGVDYDFETKSRYSVTVEAEDEQGGRRTVTVTIDLIDDDSEQPERPDKPTVTASTLNSLSLRWTAPDNPGPAIDDYDVQYSENGGPFEDWPHTGSGTTATITGLEDDTPYEVQVLARSPEGQSDWSESVDARTVANQAPRFNEGTRTARSLDENTTGTNDIGNPVTATDSDGGTLTYRLAGTDAARFDLDSSDGQLSTRSGQTWDYEEQARYEVTVRVEDGQGGSNAIEVAVNLVDQTEPPGDPAAPSVSAASSLSLTVTWEEPANTGPDIHDYDVQYRPRDRGSFRAWGHTSAERTATITSLIPDSTYQVQVLARNAEGASGWSESGTGTTDPNQLPVFTDGPSATRDLDENTTGIVDVGDPVSATDAENTSLTYSLQGSDADSFTVHSSSGQLRTRSGKTWNYESTSSYSVSVKATDGHNGERTIPVSIELNDLNEPPVFTSGASFEAAENQTFAGRLEAEDVDSGDNIATYTVTGGADQNLFEVNSSGVLTFKDAPDFEQPSDAGRNNQYNLAVTATGGTGGRALTSEQDVTVTVTDENEPPVFTSDDAFKVKENQQLVGRLIAQDVDRADVITGYEITGGADQDTFEIAGTNQLRFKEDPDFERPADSGGDNEYLVEVTATGGTDARELTEPQTVTVTVEDTDEPPGKPEPPAVSDETESSLTVTWTEPANKGPVISNYHVQYRHTGSYTAWSDSGAALSRTVTGLRSGRNYQFQVQAKNDEGEGPWSNAGSGRTLTAPTVSRVAFTSTPASGQNNTYKLNDTLDVTVTFSEAVTVTGTPQIDLTIGSTLRQADYESGSTTTQLLFEYPVQASDEDDNGAAINENGLKLNSGRIFLQKTNTTVNADLAHSPVANQSGHKVDGVAPPLTKAEVVGDELTLTYGEVLVINPPAPSDFDVTVETQARSVTAVAVSNTKVTLALASAVSTGETVALAYTPGTTPLLDRARNPAGALSNLAVANRTPIGNVCTRTAQVRDEIVSQAPVSTCGQVTPEHLAAIEGLFLYDENIPALKAGDFAGLTGLELLGLGSNSISTLPANLFSELGSLEAIDLSANSFTTLPANAFSGLSALEELYLDDNEDLGSLDASTFSGLSSLVVLDLSGNALTTLPANAFSGLSALEDLYLNDNDLAGLGANTFSGLTALTDLLLSGNNLGSLDAGLFSGLVALTNLEIYHAGVTGLAANGFSGLSALELLDLDYNDLGGLDASAFSGLSALELLYLAHAGITGLPATVFSGLSALEVLRLGGNKAGSLDESLFSGLTALRELYLSHMEISAASGNHFSGLTELEVLDLGYNELSNVEASLLSSPKELRVFSLSGNDLTRLPTTLLSGQTELRWLYLRENDFSTLPDSLFFGLTGLTRLRLEGSTVDPLPVDVSLESPAANSIRATVHTAAPFELLLPLRMANGEIDSGDETITVAQGSIKSGLLTVSRTAGTSAAVSVDLGALPGLPASDRGYMFARSGDLPLEVISAEKGVEIYPAELTMPEDDSDTYTVVLTAQPTSNVTVTVTVPSGADLTVNPSPLTFTDQDWDTPQTVTVSSSADSDSEDDEVELSHSVSGGGYGGVPADGVKVTVTETDVTANSAPVFATTSFDVEENETEVATLVATDPDDRDYITGYEVTGGRDQALFEITSRGELSFAGIPDYERPGGSSNVYAIDVTATSGMGTRERARQQQILVTVTDVDEPPGPPGPPLLGLPSTYSRVIAVTSGRRPPANTGPEITAWEIQYRVKDSGDFIGHTPDPEPDWAQPGWVVLLRNLNRATTYEVQVAAKNDEGTGEWSPSAEIEIPNQSPVVDGSLDDVTLPVGGAVEVVSVDDPFDDPDDLALSFTASSSNTSVAPVVMRGAEVLVEPKAAGSATITVTASDPLGETASTTFRADIQTPSLSAPTLSISGDLLALEFSDDFAADETRAYEVRVRHKEPIGSWAIGCFSVANDESSSKTIAITVQSLVSDFFEPGSTYEADYGYLGGDCGGSLSGVRSAVAEATVPGTPTFDIELVYAGGTPSRRVQSAFETAAARWERIIAQGIPNHRLSKIRRSLLETLYPGTTSPEVVDDLVVYVEVVEIDGPRGILGQASRLVWRLPSALPVAAGIKLDRDDLRIMTDKKLNATILHEIGHTLGFGLGTWDELNLLHNHSRDQNYDLIDPAPDTYFSGTNAIAAFNAAGGSSYTGAKVPVENSGGAGNRDSHWRESVLDHELMTPRIETANSNPLSAITIQSLADLGYTVDVTQADAYTLPSTSLTRGARASADGEGGLVLLNCIVTHPEAGPDEPEPIRLNLRRSE